MTLVFLSEPNLNLALLNKSDYYVCLLYIVSFYFDYTLVSSSGKVLIVDMLVVSSGTSSGRMYLAMFSFFISRQHKTIKNVSKIRLPKTTPIIIGVLLSEGVGGVVDCV